MLIIAVQTAELVLVVLVMVVLVLEVELGAPHWKKISPWFRLLRWTRTNSIGGYPESANGEACENGASTVDLVCLLVQLPLELLPA